MTKLNAIRDFLWVLQAFLRGKLLRQKVYRPQGNFFRLSVPVTAKRITMLVRWWRCRLTTKDELVAFWKVAKAEDKKYTLVSIDPVATAERIRYVRAFARDPFDPAVNFFCDVVYYNGTSPEELREGLGGGEPSFGTLSRRWGNSHRFLVVRH